MAVAVRLPLAMMSKPSAHFFLSAKDTVKLLRGQSAPPVTFVRLRVSLLKQSGVMRSWRASPAVAFTSSFRQPLGEAFARLAV